MHTRAAWALWHQRGRRCRPHRLRAPVRRAGPVRAAKLQGMNAPKNSPGAVPTSSGRNRYATKRTLTVGAVIVAFLVFAVFVPW